MVMFAMCVFSAITGYALRRGFFIFKNKILCIGLMQGIHGEGTPKRVQAHSIQSCFTWI